MGNNEFDFLDVGEGEFATIDQIIDHIGEEVDLSEVEGDLSVIGSISDYTQEEFVNSLEDHFIIRNENGNLLQLVARNLNVPYYVYLDDNFPIWFTTGRKTRDFPETINNYLKTEQNIGRLWISKTEMEELRQRMSTRYDDVIMPYFTATRSLHSDVEANRRPNQERTIQYYGRDGLETFNEMKYDYGVLPTNLKFQKANEFKFRVTTRGVFTIKYGGLSEVLTVIEDSINRLREVKNAIDESDFTIRENKFSPKSKIPESKPWSIHLSSQLTGTDMEKIEGEELEEWEFNLSELNTSFDEEYSYFDAELIDDRTLGKTMLRSKGNMIRVYPRENTGIDQSIRVFEFVNDQIDPESYATSVN
jgi:hypothetical protein